MRQRSAFSPLRWLSVVFLLGALILTALQLVVYSRERASFPPGLRIAGIPVGGMGRLAAAQRLLEAYSIPIEIIYDQSAIQIQPTVLDFQLDLESMLAAADLQRTQSQFWIGFWDFLWGRNSPVSEVPLRASLSEQRLRAFLEDEIALRYDQPPSPARPAVGTVDFIPGTPGTSLVIDQAIPIIDEAIRSLTQRQVVLPLERTNPSRPSLQNLKILLEQTLQVEGFDGVAGIFLYDLQNGEELHIGYRPGQPLALQPDIAYTASSIIKIPIMVSVYRRLGENPDEETTKLMSDMITKSGNEAADWLMDRVINLDRAPLDVTADLQAIGLQNTFLAGYFSFGSPLLQRIQTPANSRTDINTDPDPYSQTTPSDIGMLLQDIYQCAQTGGGSLPAVFGSDITQSECQTMIELLKNNKLPVLLTAGIPETMQIAHKHGWVSDINGIINTIGDAGIVYTPGGNYVLVVFLYHQEQLVWEPASKMVADLSRAVYNYYNLSQ